MFKTYSTTVFSFLDNYKREVLKHQLPKHSFTKGMFIIIDPSFKA